MKAVDEFITERTDDLVGLVRSLVGFDTTSVDLSPGSDAPDERGGGASGCL